MLEPFLLANNHVEVSQTFMTYSVFLSSLILYTLRHQWWKNSKDKILHLAVFSKGIFVVSLHLPVSQNFDNKRKRIPKRQSQIDNPEKLAT